VSPYEDRWMHAHPYSFEEEHSTFNPIIVAENQGPMFEDNLKFIFYILMSEVSQFIY